jgi:hypothetical protein
MHSVTDPSLARPSVRVSAPAVPSLPIALHRGQRLHPLMAHHRDPTHLGRVGVTPVSLSFGERSVYTTCGLPLTEGFPRLIPISP